MADRIVVARAADRIVRSSERTRIVTAERTRVVTGARGLPGLPGPAGVETFQANAVRALSGHRAVILTATGRADYPDGAQPLDAEAIVGVTTTAGGPGGPVTIRRLGVIEESSWAWSDGPVFAAGDGVLTQSPAPAGATWLRQVGTAIAPTRLIVELRPVIRLD